MAEMSDTHGENNPLGCQRFAGFKLEQKTVLPRLQTDDKSFLEIGHQTISECKPISSKGFQAHGSSHVGILNATLKAEPLQRKFTTWIVDVRSKAVGLEQHALRHMRSPTIHRTTKNAVG